MVEGAFAALGFDSGRVGADGWNPLGDLIAPGDRVVIKPNFVTSKNFHQRLTGELLACSSTHASVLRPIIDYALRACGPRGRVVVVDTPVEGCNVEEVLRALQVTALLAYYRSRGHDVPFYDLRYFRVVPRMLLEDVRRAGRSINLGLLLREKLPGDPRGYQVVELGERSRFCDVERRAPRLCFHRAHPHTPVPHHSGGRHEYSLPRTVLEADVVINVAKMKTHKKSGVTLALKSAIGLCNEKYWLPHYTAGTPDEDGDEYPIRPPLSVRLANQLQRLPLPPSEHSLVARAPRLGTPQNGLIDGYILEGSWEGNDTIWRTTLDLCHIVHHADRDGRLHDRPQRRHLAIVEGIVAGEGEGPLAATPRHAGLLVVGQDPVLTDLVSTRLMGFAPSRVPTIEAALQRPLLPTSQEGRLQLRLCGQVPSGAFLPPSTWPTLLTGPAEVR
jgi:uncharacterized protein (DUF362 family)